MREECGVVGIFSPNKSSNVAMDIYYGMMSLHHRGQESSGIAVSKERELYQHRDLGLAYEVFNEEIIGNLHGNAGIGHVRYCPLKENKRENVQPLVLRYKKGSLAIAVNGSLMNGAELRDEFSQTGAIYQTTSDIEVCAMAIARTRLSTHSIEDALVEAMKRFVGAYSLVLLSPRKLVAAKDPRGIRPLCMGKRKTEFGEDIVFASESAALDCIGATYVRELDPGEVVVVDDEGVRSIRTHCDKEKKSICIFEYIYFARPDSIIDGQLVNDSRMLVGRIMARESPANADIVIGAPETGRPAAIGYAREANIPYEEGFVKNRYITRTFIRPTQEERAKAVLLKLNPIKSYVKGKSVCLVDDSLVRGTTLKVIVKTLRDAGAKEVHLRICAPPFLWPCYYGTDVGSRGELLAATLTPEETAKELGADSLAYLKIEHLIDIIPNVKSPGYCDACFTGNYPVTSI